MFVVRGLWVEGRRLASQKTGVGPGGYQYFDARRTARPPGFLLADLAVKHLRDPGFYRRHRFALIAGGLALGVGYAYNCDTVPITNRTRFRLISDELERRLGNSTFKELDAEIGHKVFPAYDPRSLKVQAIGEQIVRAAGIPKLTELDWEYRLIDEPIVNCFVLPSGKVFMYRGMYEAVNGNTNLLAAVLGHEIGHVVGHHIAEKAGVTSLILLAQIVAKLVLGVPNLANAMVTKLVLELPFSRRLEQEADHIGMMLMAKACYDPTAAIAVWKQLHADNAPPAFLSSHPAHKDRYEHNQRLLPAARALQETHCFHVPAFNQAARLFQ